MSILALNVGSSSLKFGVFEAHAPSRDGVLRGEIDRHGERTVLRWHEGEHAREMAIDGSGDTAAQQALSRIDGMVPISAVVHRIVHGGMALREHCLIDDDVLAGIEQASSFAPLHVPPALAWIHHARRTWPHVAQVACFDTSFHYPLPELSRVLPVPRELESLGVQRFGFHGLSCESVLDQLVEVPSRLVIAHLGSGASITAIHHGRSVDTSMGMTPTGGIVMGTRPGDLDPGVLLFLLRQGHYTPDALEDLLEHRCGLKGMSGISADTRVLAKSLGEPRAALALAQFARSVARDIAGMAVVLGGLDLLVFTGGIGEHQPAMRDHVMALLALCFPALPHRVVPAQEEWVMARHAERLMA